MGYSPDEPRDSRGRWSSSTGGGSGSLVGSHTGPLRKKVSDVLARAPSPLTHGDFTVGVYDDYTSHPDGLGNYPSGGAAVYLHSMNQISLFADVMRPMSELDKNITVFHELFHRYDRANSGVTPLYSSNREFRSALNSDVRNLRSAEKKDYSYFLTPVEAYAELSAAILSGTQVKHSFARTSNWLMGHLHKQGILK